MKVNTVWLISAALVLVSVMIGYLLLLPKNTITVYSNGISRDTLITLKNVIEVKDEFLFTKINYESLLEKTDNGIYPKFINVSTVKKEELDSYLEETLFLEYLVSKDINKAEKYIEARIENIETLDWKNFIKYSDSKKEYEDFESKKDKVIIKKEENFKKTDQIIKDNNLNLINNTLITLNNYSITNKIDSPYKLIMAITNSNIENTKIKNPFANNKTYNGLYGAYSNKDCNNKSKQYGELKGKSEEEFYCEYTEAPELIVQILSQKDNGTTNMQQKIDYQEIVLNNFIYTNFKNIKIVDSGELDPNLVQELGLGSDRLSIALLSKEIVDTPIYQDLSKDGLLVENNQNYYLILQ